MKLPVVSVLFHHLTTPHTLVRWQDLFRETALSNGPLFDTFLNQLLTTLNWTVTEFTVALGDLPSAAAPHHARDLPAQHRKCNVMFELAVSAGLVQATLDCTKLQSCSVQWSQFSQRRVI